MYDEDLANLEDWLRRLKVEYDIFFNGHRKKPPDDLRMKLERIVKQLSEAGDLSFQQRFRYNTLVARYYVYKDLWRRTLLERESAADAETPSAAAQTGTSQTSSGESEVRVAVSDPALELDSIRNLYENFVKLSQERQEGSPAVPFDRFLAYLSKQTKALRGKYHCHRVVFTLAVEDSSVRFRARPDYDAGSDTASA